MTMVYLVAVFCLASPPQNIYLRRPPPVEAPACLPHREEFAGTVTECSHSSLREVPRLKALYPSFDFRGVYCFQEGRK